MKVAQLKPTGCCDVTPPGNWSFAKCFFLAHKRHVNVFLVAYELISTLNDVLYVFTGLYRNK